MEENQKKKLPYALDLMDMWRYQFEGQVRRVKLCISLEKNILHSLFRLRIHLDFI